MTKKFRPALFPTIFTIGALIVLISLGNWQVQRLQWKKDLVSKIDESVAMPALDAMADFESLEDMQYRRVLAEGEFLHDHEMHLYTGPKFLKGKPGYNIITPMRLLNNRVILVDRGWVPSEKKDQPARPETLISGTVNIEAMIHKGERKGFFTPDNDEEGNLWFWLDTKTIFGIISHPYRDVYVRVIKKTQNQPNTLPIAGNAQLTHRNDHLQYAITWYSLAIILLVIYVIYSLRE